MLIITRHDRPSKTVFQQSFIRFKYLGESVEFVSLGVWFFRLEDLESPGLGLYVEFKPFDCLSSQSSLFEA